MCWNVIPLLYCPLKTYTLEIKSLSLYFYNIFFTLYLNKRVSNMLFKIYLQLFSHAGIFIMKFAVFIYFLVVWKRQENWKYQRSDRRSNYSCYSWPCVTHKIEIHTYVCQNAILWIHSWAHLRKVSLRKKQGYNPMYLLVRKDFEMLNIDLLIFVVLKGLAFLL